MKKTFEFGPPDDNCHVCPFLAVLRVESPTQRRVDRFVGTLMRLFDGTIPTNRRRFPGGYERTTRVSCAPTTHEHGKCMRDMIFNAQGAVDGAVPGGFVIKGYPNRRCIRD